MISKKNMIERMRETLFRVYSLAGEGFAGIGIIVHSHNASLPVFPLRLQADPPIGKSLEQSLAEMATYGSEYHDGFHLLSVDWNITAISQYFSPPIIPHAQIKWSRKFGGRYLAAQFGSTIPGVELCGIATSSLGIAIFQSGREVYFEEI